MRKNNHSFINYSHAAQAGACAERETTTSFGHPSTGGESPHAIPFGVISPKLSV
jgi:hypothetical protein